MLDRICPADNKTKIKIILFEPKSIIKKNQIIKKTNECQLPIENLKVK